jgi:cytochrome b561
MLCVGFLLDSIPEQYQGIAYMMHKSIGISLLVLMILRLIIVLASKRPALPATVAHWERILSRFVQYSFYVLLILMPLSGWIMSTAANRIPSYFGLFSLPFPGINPNEKLADFMLSVHEIIAYTLIVFISLHILGALKHHFIDKDNVLKSMLPHRT